MKPFSVMNVNFPFVTALLHGVKIQQKNLPGNTTCLYSNFLHKTCALWRKLRCPHQKDAARKTLAENKKTAGIAPCGFTAY
ncbi:MAG: hypothetical protein JO269_13180 [Burkholderiaceae bacterium]|nr:hypothetical protein [Burkholderiaceae bacterium]